MSTYRNSVNGRTRSALLGSATRPRDVELTLCPWSVRVGGKSQRRPSYASARIGRLQQFVLQDRLALGEWHPWKRPCFRALQRLVLPSDGGPTGIRSRTTLCDPILDATHLLHPNRADLPSGHPIGP